MAYRDAIEARTARREILEARLARVENALAASRGLEAERDRLSEELERVELSLDGTRRKRRLLAFERVLVVAIAKRCGAFLARARRPSLCTPFTAIEIIVVALLILAMVPCAPVASLPQLRRAREEQTRADAVAVGGAALRYRSLIGLGACPTVAELQTYGWLAPMWRTSDAWDDPFVVECAGDDIDVVSAGPDGRLETSDDIRVRVVAQPASSEVGVASP